jgi:hypothetical protein
VLPCPYVELRSHEVQGNIILSFYEILIIGFEVFELIVCNYFEWRNRTNSKEMNKVQNKLKANVTVLIQCTGYLCQCVYNLCTSR